MILKDTKLFKNTNIDTSNIKILEFPDNYPLHNEGEESTYVGIVLEGKIIIKVYSLGGRNFTINTLNEGMIFGDILLYRKDGNTYPGNLTTKGTTKLALIPNNQIKRYLQNDIFLSNFLEMLSNKVYQLNHKNKLLSQDTIRDKIIIYLTEEQHIQSSSKIILGMTKEELANHLFIPRPSLSRELIKMKEEGLIDYDRHSITLIGLK